TRFSRDWSSDVCSSDLTQLLVLLAVAVSHAAAYEMLFYQGNSCRSGGAGNFIGGTGAGCETYGSGMAQSAIVKSTGPVDDAYMRSEERRVGTEGKSQRV